MNKHVIFIIGYIFLIALGYKYLLIKEKEIENNRYEIVMSSVAARWQYLLDKREGKTWQLIVYGSDQNGPRAWTHLPRLDNDNQLGEFTRVNG